MTSSESVVVAPSVFLDANVLFIGVITNLFQSASLLHLIDVYWSEKVIEEYLEHSPDVYLKINIKKKSNFTREMGEVWANRKITSLKKHSNFKMVIDFENEVIDTSKISDKKDYHVYKAAKKAKCSFIITSDKDFKNFNAEVVSEIIAKKADEFFSDLFEIDSSIVTKIFEDFAAFENSKNKTSFSHLEHAEKLINHNLSKISKKLRIHYKKS